MISVILFLDPEDQGTSTINPLLGHALDVPARGCFPLEGVCHGCSVVSKTGQVVFYLAT